MSCLSETRRARLQTKLTKYEAWLDAIDNAQENGVFHIELYNIDTGEGRQQIKYRSMSQMLDEREKIQAVVDRLYNILEGTGLVNMNLRRKTGSGH
jgi:hypothetical protein